MFEPLGPNMARTLMGDAYNPAYKYELETDADGFHVIITDKQSGKSKSVRLEPEEPDEVRLTPIWRQDLDRRLQRNDLLSRLLFGCCILATAVCVVAALLGKV